MSPVTKNVNEFETIGKLGPATFGEPAAVKKNSTNPLCETATSSMPSAFPSSVAMSSTNCEGAKTCGGITVNALLALPRIQRTALRSTRARG